MAALGLMAAIMVSRPLFTKGLMATLQWVIEVPVLTLLIIGNHQSTKVLIDMFYWRFWIHVQGLQHLMLKLEVNGGQESRDQQGNLGTVNNLIMTWGSANCTHECGKFFGSQSPQPCPESHEKSVPPS